MADTAVATEAPSPTEHGGAHKLGPFLCWAVVFADIGTSVYYVPGILWRQVQWQSGLFVLLTLIAFTLLIFTYAEVSVRFPEGGGVVSSSASGIAPWAGVVGGTFILGSYFLTSAISSLSGLLYFSTFLGAIKPYVLPITVVVVVLLGFLNFWGIKESATVSAFIAVAALVSDFVILLVVVISVPPSTMVRVFEKVFTGHLDGVTILTGFAGAFLAFSGLESISQLSPVMKLPRGKTVSKALALVAITVGITSPLLTIFSTVLLNSPDLLATTNVRMLVTPFPDTFISDLAGTYGGMILLIATAIAASALLVFACNTAIIGAYHVFMALSRMGYLPKFFTAINAWRGTPHNAILVATGIPVIVLLAVGGRIDILGDLYAFGLLGAFTLTCLSMSVIRYRDLRGASHIGAMEAAERSAGTEESASRAPWPMRLGDAAGRVLNDQLATRLHAAAERLSPWVTSARAAWPTVKFYLGIVTTFLVGIAWITNLFAKPLATVFGGGFTVIGVTVALLYHQRLVVQGEAPVVPMQRLQRMPRSLLVALSSASEYNRQVIDAAIETADEHQLVFLYLSRKPTQSPRFMQFADPYLTDVEAQRILIHAHNQAKRAGLKASFIYRLGGAGQVIDIWRVIRPDEIIAEAVIAKKVSKYVPPDYVRYQQFDGVRVAHYVRHKLPQSRQTPLPETGSGLALGGDTFGEQGGRTPSAQERIQQAQAEAELARSERSRRDGRASVTGGPTPRPWHRRTAPEVPPMETPESATTSTPSPDEEDWIWTGTDLVRKPPQEESRGEGQEGGSSGS